MANGKINDKIIPVVSTSSRDKEEIIDLDEVIVKDNNIQCNFFQYERNAFEERFLRFFFKYSIL